MDENDNDPPTFHNTTPVPTEVTTTDICNLQWNIGLHIDDAADNKEDEQSEVNEDEESVTQNKNLRNHDNYTPNENGNKNNQQYELDDENPNAPTTGLTLVNNENNNKAEETAPTVGFTYEQGKDDEDIDTQMNNQYGARYR